MTNNTTIIELADVISALNSDVEDLRNEVRITQDKRLELERENGALQASLTDAHRQIKAAEQRYMRLSEENEMLEDKVAALKHAHKVYHREPKAAPKRGRPRLKK